MDSEGQPARREPRALGMPCPELLWEDGSGISRGTALTERVGCFEGPSLLGGVWPSSLGLGPRAGCWHTLGAQELAEKTFSVFCFSLSFDEDEDDLEEEHVTKVRGRVLGFLCDWAWEKGSPSDLLTRQAGLRPGTPLLGAAWACVPQGIEVQPFWAQARGWGGGGMLCPLDRGHTPLSFCPRFHLYGAL